MSSDAVMPETRLYGNWRRARGFDIGALGTGQTLTVFGVVLAPILAAYVSPRAALLLGLIGAVVVGLVVVRVGLDLADRSQADAWVASWGAWLADLGYQPLVRWIAVIVDTAPPAGRWSVTTSPDAPTPTPHPPPGK